MAEITFHEDELIVSKTDLKGKITYGNELFLKFAGYSEEEIIDAPHNIVRNADMPKIIFKLLWETISSGKEIYAYVVNRSKNGDHYWVFANVTPSYDANAKMIGYYSVRRKPSQRALNIIQPLYKELLMQEKNGGMSASQKTLEKLILDNGGRYDKFILSL